MVTCFGLIESGVACCVFRPREIAAIDDHATQSRAVSAHVLGYRVHDYVYAVLNGFQQRR